MPKFGSDDGIKCLDESDSCFVAKLQIDRGSFVKGEMTANYVKRLFARVYDSWCAKFGSALSTGKQ